MSRNHNDPNIILDRAVAAMRSHEPAAEHIHAAADRVWQNISAAGTTSVAAGPVMRVEGCADVVRLLPDYRAQRLSEARTMLVTDHLRECASCRMNAADVRSLDAILPWKSETLMLPRRWSFGSYALAASLLVAAVLGLYIGRSGVLSPSGERASVQSVEGAIYRVTATGEQRAKVGDQFSEGELVRTASGSRAVLRLRDGSTVEMNARSQLRVSVGLRNAVLHLDRGAVIVQAAKRRMGHLYVETADCRVAVTGTVFSVNAGIKGSRVSVIEGTVDVARAAGEVILHSGEQTTSTPAVEEVPVQQEIAWSQNLDQHLALLAEFAKLDKQFQSIRMPDLRYDSRLLRAVPDGTIVYGGIPNLGDAVAQANSIFQQELASSAVLQQWWQHRQASHSGMSFDSTIETIHNLSQYVGNEIVFGATSSLDAQHGSIFAIAQVAKPGLAEFLASQIAQHTNADSVHVLAPEDLQDATQGTGRDMYILVTPEFTAASPYVGTLRDLSARWAQPDSSGFVQSDFGQRIATEYASGAGLMLAVNLGAITNNAQQSHANEAFARSGFADVKFLVADRKDANNQVLNSAQISFNGPRQGIASWLAAPAPIGALDFITPNASVAGAFVAKSPALMVDDLLQLSTSGSNGAQNPFADADAELNIDIRNDLAASLGGEGAFALDGPLLPTPSWKAIFEVYDPQKLQYCLQQMVAAANRKLSASGQAMQIALDQQQVGDRVFYTIHAVNATMMMPLELHYTFADGYLVAGPSQAMVQDGIRARETGDSISHSDSFRAMLPSDQHANVSGLLYQNLSPVLGPIAGQLTPSQLQSVQTIVSNSEPTLICAYGQESEIDIASNSRSFGLDLKSLTIGTLLKQLKSGTPLVANP
jgi:hypothetical protein